MHHPKTSKNGQTEPSNTPQKTPKGKATHTRTPSHGDTPAPARNRTGDRVYAATGTTLTRKQARFARAYVETNGNGSESARIAGYSPNSVGIQAHENIQKPKVKREIERLFEEQGLSLDVVQSIHKRNIEQDKHLPTSQTAIRDYYRVTGRLEEQSNTTVAIQFNVEK